MIIVTSFVSADVENQREVKPNAVVADDALMEQCQKAESKLRSLKCSLPLLCPT